MSNDLDWLGLADVATQADPQELKRRIDLVVVCEDLGVQLEPEADGRRWVGLCPFHDDARPSFSVYETDDGAQRCGCFACDFGPSNDLFDLLKTIRGYGFREALQEAQRYAAASQLEPRRPREPKPPVDLTPFVQGAASRASDDRAAILALFHARGLTAPVDWTIEQFGLGTTPDGGGVVVPHFDRTGACVAAKVRRQTADDEHHPWTPIAVGGSKLHELYGVWRDHGHADVVLVEGESDTWTTAYLLRLSDVDVLGLPSGAAARPRREWLDYLQGRNVTLMFDADAGGRTALRNWSAALGVCRVALLNEGLDPSKERPDRVIQAIAHSTVVGTAPTPGLVEAPFGGLVRANDQNQTMVSNFVLKLVSTIELGADGVTDPGHVFTVALPDGRVATVTTSDFENDGKLRKWANTHGYVWQGATKDAQEVLRMLLLDSVFHPRLRGTSVGGWIDDGFVFPEPHGCIGGRSWAYVQPDSDYDLTQHLALEPGEWDPHVPQILSALHRADVVTPVIGWIAAAPLRAHVNEFPILAVVGGAGHGKTTLLRECLATFGFSVNSTLTSTTPYGVEALFNGTNAVPTWFDEYRVGARTDAKERFEQLLRNAWTAQASYKGGVGDDKQKLRKIVARAPIVVSGEDAFTETSHLERMVLLGLPKDGRNPQALDALYAAHRVGFGRAYLEWLRHLVATGALPEPPQVNDRPRQARAVARWGYGLFADFAIQVCGVEVAPYDESLINRNHQAAAEHNVIEEALKVCEDRNAPGGNGQIVWRTTDGVRLVRVYDLVREARALGITLPGNASAVRRELEEMYDVTEEKGMWGTQLRLNPRS